MGRLKVSTSVYLEEEQLERLEQLSKRTGKPVAALIRDGIDLALERNRHQLPPMRTERDACIWCSHDFGVLLMNKDGRPVRCAPSCDKRVGVGWMPATRPEDVGRVMANAKRQMRLYSCRPPGTLDDD